MYGTHINTLNVYVQPPSNLGPSLSNPVWTRKGTQGNQWLQAKVQITPSGTYQVKFTDSVKIHSINKMNSINICTQKLEAYCCGNNFLSNIGTKGDNLQ